MIRYNWSRNLENCFDIDGSAIAGRDLVGGVEVTDVSRVVEIGDRADAPCSVAPKPNEFQIAIDVFQHLRADDRIVVAHIRPAVEGVADEEQVWPRGAGAGVADRLRAEVEAAVTTVVLLQDHFR